MQPVQSDVTADDSGGLSVIVPAAGGLAGSVAAIFAALCCVGPSTAALLGAGGAVATSALSPYRPVFLIASFALIAFGFRRMYARRVVAADGRVCPVRAGRLARTILWTSAAVWLAAAILPWLLG
jgi:hypothetical protein